MARGTRMGKKGPNLFERPTNEVQVRIPAVSQIGCECRSCMPPTPNNRTSTKNQCGLHRKTCHKPRKNQIVIVKKALTAIPVKARCLDIRSLNAKRDRVQIYGQNKLHKLPVKVDRDGRLEVVSKVPSPAIVFSEETLTGITVTDRCVALPLQMTSDKTVYTYSVVNHGPVAILATVEISPDGVHFAFDSSQEIISNETVALVPNYFLKYTRLNLQAVEAATTASVDVYFQAQTIS